MPAIQQRGWWWWWWWHHLLSSPTLCLNHSYTDTQAVFEQRRCRCLLAADTRTLIVSCLQGRGQPYADGAFEPPSLLCPPLVLLFYMKQTMYGQQQRDPVAASVSSATGSRGRILKMKAAVHKHPCRSGDTLQRSTNTHAHVFFFFFFLMWAQHPARSIPITRKTLKFHPTATPSVCSLSFSPSVSHKDSLLFRVESKVGRSFHHIQMQSSM